MTKCVLKSKFGFIRFYANDKLVGEVYRRSFKNLWRTAYMRLLCCWLLSLKITIVQVNIARAFFFTLRFKEINFFVYFQALVREQQKTQEVGRLQEVINKILREAGKRTREEVIVLSACFTALIYNFQIKRYVEHGVKRMMRWKGERWRLKKNKEVFLMN